MVLAMSARRLAVTLQAIARQPIDQDLNRAHGCQAWLAGTFAYNAVANRPGVLILAQLGRTREAAQLVTRR